MIYKPIWLKYEGEFTFDYKCQVKEDEFCFQKEAQILKDLTEQIKQAYPNEMFELESVGSSKNTMTVEVKANKSLNDKFALYPLGWRLWEYNELSLRSVWKG